MLTVRNLSTSYTTNDSIIEAVNDLSFSVNKKETLAIVGESGSGKSALALSILQLLPDNGRITSGKIFFQDSTEVETDLLTLSSKKLQEVRWKKIAMIFQEPMSCLNPVMRCGKQVEEAIIHHLRFSTADARTRTIELFNRVKLPDPESIYDAFPHQLSGGQKQRVMIAMAISCNPDLLIADEPTTSLDVSTQKQILELLRELQSETGMGMIFISHDLSVVSSVANKVLVMHRGKKVEEGTTDSVFHFPQHPYTKALLACRPDPNRELIRLPVLRDFMLTNIDGTYTEIKTSVEDVLTELRHTNESMSLQFKSGHTNKILLDVQDISVRFTTRKNIFSTDNKIVKAVDGISFRISRGETVGLVGESGSGKSTVAKAIAGLVTLSVGTILFESSNVSDRDFRNSRGRKIQMIFQDPYSSLNPKMKIGEAIMEPMIVHKLHTKIAAREQTSRLLELVGLRAEHFHRFPEQFSGGQRQRICIARALAAEPELLICDECVSSLDVSVQAQILNLLNEIKAKRKLSLLFISHDLAVAKFMSDTMLIMQNGKIIEAGDPKMIYANPATAYTAQLINAIPTFSLQPTR
jgi:peptide/nickel transport system ATP-binding protein